MKLEELLKSLDILETSGPGRGEVSAVACDSRSIRPGGVFVAIPGSRRDGWSYADDAVARGAIALVTEHSPGRRPEICQVRVADARLAAGRLAAAFHGRPAAKLTVAGITGTNGKTTTAYMLRDILRQSGREPGLISTVAYEIGTRSIPAGRTTPEAPALQAMLAEMTAVGCRSAVMEVSSHALDQKRTEGIDFDAAVFTNLTRDHLDYHHDMETYFRAKSRLFLELGHGKAGATALINRDDPWGRRMAELDGLQCGVLTYGIEGSADIRAENVKLESSGSAFEVVTPWGRAKMTIGLLGRYNISNALAATAAAGALGVGPGVSAEALFSVSRVPGRLEEVHNRRGFQVFVDYAHTDDALERVLTTLREITPQRLLVVFGCGGNRDASKRPSMGAVASRLADYSILTSDNPRGEDPAAILAQIRRGFGDNDKYEVIENRRSAIRQALGTAREGDVVVIAGKGHENFQEFADKTIAFDDRQVVMEYLDEKGPNGKA